MNNKRIIGYTMLEAPSSDHLIHDVNELISQGYQPYGSPVVVKQIDFERDGAVEVYAQAMVMYEEDED
jgi:hypothetical protein